MGGIPVEVASREAVPRYIDAKCCISLLSATLVDTASSFHNFLNRFVVTQFELMDNLLTILKHSNLPSEPQ